MTRRKIGARRGFSLVELLAVVLILVVLAGVAIPLYINSRKSSAARACLGNLAAIAKAQSAWSLRKGSYLTGAHDVVFKAYPDGLVGAPEGLAVEPKCPEGGTYSVSNDSGGCIIKCDDTAKHGDIIGPEATTYQQKMAAPATESRTGN